MTHSSSPFLSVAILCFAVFSAATMSAGKACGNDNECAFQGPNGIRESCVNGQCVEFGFLQKCNNNSCPQNIQCDFRGNCIKRGGKGEPCKGGRFPSFDGFDCKFPSETGGQMLTCFPGPDSQPIPGPGPGGVGGGFSGIGICK